MAYRCRVVPYFLGNGCFIIFGSAITVCFGIIPIWAGWMGMLSVLKVLGCHFGGESGDLVLLSRSFSFLSLKGIPVYFPSARKLILGASCPG